MTFGELETSLPNGLHDAELLGIEVDYAERRAVLTVSVDVGDSNDEQESYRQARLRFVGIQFVVVEPPTDEHSYDLVSMIDAGSGTPHTSPISLPAIFEDCFLCWIFVTRWNSFIRISARDVVLEWCGVPA